MSSYAICPVEACTSSHKIEHAMCSRHWSMVPRYMKAEVYRAWDRRLAFSRDAEASLEDREDARANHRDAVERAVRSVEDTV